MRKKFKIFEDDFFEKIGWYVVCELLKDVVGEIVLFYMQIILDRIVENICEFFGGFMIFFSCMFCDLVVQFFL